MCSAALTVNHDLATPNISRMIPGCELMESDDHQYQDQRLRVPLEDTLTIDQYKPCRVSDTQRYGMRGINPPRK